ncbi:eukaryotic translation initiation factor 3 subunit E-like [Halichondria panicea]|uniref:eukaryotic translation initiation factor 3 subunit E-like n=1 Tax=Halichondria panicea TaxID=6063 RepID=UPI00312BA9E9
MVPNLVERRGLVVSKLHEFDQALGPILDILTDSEELESSSGKEDQNLLEYLIQNHQFEVKMVDVIHDCAKFKFECGTYADAAEYLYFYRLLAPADHQNLMSAEWGKLSCSILV